MGRLQEPELRVVLFAGNEAHQEALQSEGEGHGLEWGGARGEDGQSCFRLTLPFLATNWAASLMTSISCWLSPGGIRCV